VQNPELLTCAHSTVVTVHERLRRRHLSSVQPLKLRGKGRPPPTLRTLSTCARIDRNSSRVPIHTALQVVPFTDNPKDFFTPVLLWRHVSTTMLQTRTLRTWTEDRTRTPDVQGAQELRLEALFVSGGCFWAVTGLFGL
jgi:hypothetical protein